MSVIFATIPAGQSVSSAFAIDRPADRVVLGVPSHAALGWRLEWAHVLSGPFAPAARDDGTGLVSDAFSGSAGAWFAGRVLGACVRVRTSAAVSATMSATITPSPYF
ncbi:MAG: hypothetical protein KIT14_12580 [bacterium]|nr:hypothetical protein [bacterium]